MQKAMYTGIPMIMEAFETISDGMPFFSVWLNSKDIAYSWNKEDLDQGKQRLEELLEAWKQGGHNDILIIKFHPEKEGKIITNKTPVMATMYVRVNELEVLNGMTNDGSMTLQTMNGIAGLKTFMTEKFAGIEDRISKVETPEPEPAGNPLGVIGEVLSHPQIGPAIVQMAGPLIGQIVPMLTQIFEKITGQFAPQQLQPMVINGIPEEKTEAEIEAYNARLDEALDVLEKHCNLADDLSKLAWVAVNKPEMFKMVLSSLRSIS